MTAQQIITAANSLQLIDQILLALQAQILLLQQQTGNTMTGTQLSSAAAQQFGMINTPMLALQCILYLQAQNAGGGGGTSGFGPPSAPPSSGTFSLYFDTSLPVQPKVWYWTAATGWVKFLG